ncbi:MAG: hypothetical protein DWQ07_09470 [Chloroflexi bacterium]|nr:MAG: hypothetical protein DWQ07_09470 [Chloroflexota bacterium]MBL1193058.1 hypothetical protein [Chloroflexota bacterium]NOH10351.1 hypothetical protein [Chloroflexota bacterium]
MADIKRILENLRNSDLEIREEGLKQIREFDKKLSHRDIQILLEASIEEFPDLRWDFNNSKHEIIQLLTKYISDEHIPLVVDAFPNYDGLTKSQALQLLGQLESQKAARTLLQLLDLSASELEFKFGSGYLVHGQPHHADIFFPDLLNYLDIEPLVGHILGLCLKCFENGLLDPGQLDSDSGKLIRLCESYREQVRHMEKDEDHKWIWEDEYLSIRGDFAILIDLFGYFNHPEVDRELAIAAEADDPKIRMFAIISRLRKGKKVDVSELTPIAAYSETRMWLYKMLLSLDKVALYPLEYFSQEAFAESEMVDWLSFGTELGKVPDEIELMKVFELDVGTTAGKILYYLYRFRTFPPHWAAKDGWMAGVSGPFIKSDEPSPDSYGETFSTFKAWQSLTPEEHLRDIQEILNRWRSRHNKLN